MKIDLPKKLKRSHSPFKSIDTAYSYRAKSPILLHAIKRLSIESLREYKMALALSEELVILILQNNLAKRKAMRNRHRRKIALYCAQSDLLKGMSKMVEAKLLAYRKFCH